MTYIIQLPNFRNRLTTRLGWRRSAILIGVTALAFGSANLSGTASATTSTIGTTAVGSSTDTGDGGSITCNRYGATGSGAVSSMSVNVGAVDASSKGYALAIYSDASSNPSSLLGSATGTLAANSWNTLSVSATVTSGGYYWLCYNSSTSNSSYNNLRYTSGSTPAIYKAQSYGTWPASFGTVGSQWTDNYSIYATVGSSTPTSTTTTTTPPSSTTTTTPPTSTTTPPTSTTTTSPPATIQPTKLISRSVPAFASSGTASNANDADYNTTWQPTSTAAWLTYDLSSVSAANRKQVLLVWYNEATLAFDPAMALESAIRIPQNYTIEINTAAGGTTAPTTGWTTKTTVTGNKYHSRQHVLDMTGANWIRLSVTAVLGGSNADINVDVYDASQGLADDWIIYGSSTPSAAMNHTVVGNTLQSFSQMINQAKPNYFPVQENGSISGIDTFGGVNNINTWLAQFPGKYVAIALGANDADECVAPATFYSNFVTMINAVTSAGKIPVVPLFNWSKLAPVQSCGPGLIQEIKQLYIDYPQVVQGPDFWTFFMNNPQLISSDNTHPTDIGLGIYRQMWAQTMLANVYK
jgi:hypothetical protein